MNHKSGQNFFKKPYIGRGNQKFPPKSVTSAKVGDYFCEELEQWVLSWATMIIP